VLLVARASRRSNSTVSPGRATILRTDSADRSACQPPRNSTVSPGRATGWRT